jgi:hypothetical protein
MNEPTLQQLYAVIGELFIQSQMKDIAIKKMQEDNQDLLTKLSEAENGG